ncbi:kelch-like protein 24 isoform X2 [Mercenaria mercenaria]|uniref:kelch-like protein 24 isoform X2 n=1 Tax=Mercenaria mercenaria TaxID=6596 RepID=UPI00234E6889|nr:kelch-like protein 24 isoform X2 [Mercenaria mercenaria]
MANLKQRHMEALKTGMESLRDDAALTDVEIIVNNRIFRCHKSILVAISPYFRAMFTTGMKESNQKRITLQVDCLQDHCEEVLLEQLKGDNCLEMYRLACMYNCKKLKKKAWPAILDGFCTVWKSEEFTSLTAEEVIAIIREDKLVTLDEEHVCEAALKWINTDFPKRKKYIYDLFKHVRLPHVTPEYLVKNLSKMPCLMENPDCRKLLENAQHYHMLPSRRLDYSGERLRYRIDDDLDEVLLVITENSDKRGMYYEGAWCLWAYSYNQHRWFTLAPIQRADSPGLNFAFCSHSYNIFVSGGSNNPKNLLKFESERNEWITSSGQLKKGRSHHCMVSVGNALYCLGGNNVRLPKSSQVMGSIEEFYIPGQRWRTVGELSNPVCSAAAAVCGEQILVFGGTNIDGKQVSFVQCFHSRTKESTVISNLPYIAKRLLSVTIGEEIYIMSVSEDGHSILKLTSDLGFTDAGFEIPTDQNLLGTSHHDECMIVLTENPKANGNPRNIVQVDLETSQTKVFPVKGNGCPKPVHGCHRSYIDKRFLYHTYFQ